MRLITLSLAVLACSSVLALSRTGSPSKFYPLNSPYNAACDGSTADTQAFAKLVSAIGTDDAFLEMPAGKQCKVGTLTIPANVTVNYADGGGFFITTGETLTLLGPQIASSQQIFYNALPSEGRVSFVENSSAATVRPEWWRANTQPGVTDMTDAINAAIQAANPGSIVALSGSYQLSGSGPELVLVNKNVNLVGTGAMGTFLAVAPNVGPSTDVIHVNIPGEARFLTIRNLTIVPDSGHPARHGINLDISKANQRLANISITENYIEQLGGHCIHLSNPLPNLNGFFVSQIQRNFLVGGMSLQNSGDSIAIRDNTIAGADAERGIEISTVAGAVKTIIEGNNITTAGGAIKINSGDLMTIANNNIEQVFPYRGSSYAMVDIIGSAGAHVTGTILKNNTINALGKAVTLVRVDNADHTIIEDNNLQKGTSAGITVTANAVNTDIRSQRWGSPEVEPSVNDSGTATKGVYKTPTLATGWATDRAKTAAVKYWKDSANQVHFSGLVTTTQNAPGLPTILWTLPVGFRPATVVYLPITAVSTGGQAISGYLRVTAAGAVSLEKTNLAANDQVILYSLSFPAATP
jgi:hypothetical protein